MSRGLPGGAGYEPSRCDRSAGLRPACVTRTSTSSLPGTGIRQLVETDDLVAAGSGEDHCAHVCSLGWILRGSLDGRGPLRRLTATVAHAPRK